MRKYKFFSVFVLLALMLSAGSGAALAQKSPLDKCDRATAEALVGRLVAAGGRAEVKHTPGFGSSWGMSVTPRTEV